MTTKPSHSSPPWSITTKAIVAVVVLLLSALLIWRFRELLSPLIIAALLAYILNPLVTWIDVRSPLSRVQTVLIVYGVLALLFFAGTAAVGFVAVEQVFILSDLLPQWAISAIELIPSLPSFIPADLSFLNFTIDLSPLRAQVEGQFETFNLTSINWRSVGTQVLALIEPLFSRGGLLAANIVGATVNVLGLAFLVFVISIYMANDALRFGQAISNLAHQPGYRQDADRLMAAISQVWAAYLRGQVLLGVLIFFVVSAVLGVMGVTNALGLGLLSGVMEFLPVIGPLVGTGAAILVAFFQQTTPWGLTSFQFALAVAGVMLLIQQLENNILVPRIVGDALGSAPAAGHGQRDHGRVAGRIAGRGAGRAGGGFG